IQVDAHGHLICHPQRHRICAAGGQLEPDGRRSVYVSLGNPASGRACNARWIEGLVVVVASEREDALGATGTLV
ncbi:MAG: hypothetical protein PVH50_11190, partial [Anaerolineae bacterium]